MSTTTQESILGDVSYTRAPAAPPKSVTRRGLLTFLGGDAQPTSIDTPPPADDHEPPQVTPTPLERVGGRHFSRRGFLRLVGNVTRAGLGVMIVDNYLGEALTSSKNSTVEAYTQDGDYLFPDTFNFIFTGFGAMYPEKLAKSLSPTFNQYGQTAFIRYGNADINFESIADNIYDYMTHSDNQIDPSIPRKDRKTVSLYGHSMGGIVAFEVGAELKKKYDVDLCQIFLDCSPARENDVKSAFKRFLIGVLDISDRIGIHGGPILRGTLESLDKISEGNITFEAMIDRLTKGLPGHALDNSTIQGQAGVIRASYVYMQQSSSDIIGDTPVYHIAPSNPENDEVVDNVSARESWKAVVKNLIQIDLEGTGHANPMKSQAHITRPCCSVSNKRAYKTLLQQESCLP